MEHKEPQHFSGLVLQLFLQDSKAVKELTYPKNRDLLYSDSQKTQHMVLSSGEQDILMENTAQHAGTNF